MMKKLVMGVAAAAVAISSTVPAYAAGSFDYNTRLANYNEYKANGWWNGYDVAGDGWTTCIPNACYIGEDTLKPGTLKPVVTDARTLFLESQKVGDPILVASEDGTFVMYVSPFIVELAKQNGVSVEFMMALLYDNSVDRKDGDKSFREVSVELTKTLSLVVIEAGGIDYKAENAVLLTTIDTLEAQILVLMADADTNAATITALKATVDTLKASLANVKIDAAELLVAYNDLMSDRDSLIIINTALNADLVDAQNEIDALTAERYELLLSLEASQAEIDALQVQIDDLIVVRDSLTAQLTIEYNKGLAEGTATATHTVEYVEVKGDDVIVYVNVPGETVYVDVPGETVYVNVPGETVYVNVPGETVTNTIVEYVTNTVTNTVTVEVPGETITVYETNTITNTVYVDVPGETITIFTGISQEQYDGLLGVWRTSAHNLVYANTVIADLEAEIAALEAAGNYADGYSDGYSDGYNDGQCDAFAAINAELYGTC